MYMSHEIYIYYKNCQYYVVIIILDSHIHVCFPMRTELTHMVLLNKVMRSSRSISLRSKSSSPASPLRRT